MVPPFNAFPHGSADAKCKPASHWRRTPLRINGLRRSRARERRYQDRWEKCKARLRAKVEHPFRGIKRQFGHTKVGSRGLAKNAVQVASKDPTVNACTESFGPIRCHPRDRHD